MSRAGYAAAPMAVIADALRGLNDDYVVEEVVARDSGGSEVVVMSDLHLADGRRHDGTYHGTEQFFADEAFARLLDRLHADAGERGVTLVLNGDIVDFLRIVRTPDDADIAPWARLLERLGAPQRPEVLRAITKKERSFGLKTHDYKSAWKLSMVARGHEPFFRALARFIERGNRVIVVKGNHDLEWYWPLVRNTLRLLLAERMDGESSDEAITERIAGPIASRLSFVDHAIVFDGALYIEHGHRYDRYSHVVNGPTLESGEELNIPFGSFFNRYLVNKIELSYPYIDNVRPRENLLPVLLRERFSLGIRLMLGVPRMLWLIPSEYYGYMFRKFALTVLAFALPIAAVIAIEWPLIMQAIGRTQAAASTTVGSIAFSIVRDVAAILSSYLLARLVAAFQLVEPTSLAHEARRLFRERSKYRFVTFGHTHDPDTFEHEGRWFHNTGTWIPIVETSSAEIRHDRTYTYLHCRSADSPGTLLRWNDDAGRPDRALILQRPLPR